MYMFPLSLPDIFSELRTFFAVGGVTEVMAVALGLAVFPQMVRLFWSLVSGR